MLTTFQTRFSPRRRCLQMTQSCTYESLQSLRDCAALQADLDSFAAWTCDWLISFNKEKCVVLRIRKSLQFTYFIDGHPLQEVSEHKDLGITVSSALKPSRHIVTICKKVTQRLGMINRCFTNHSRSVISPLYKSIVCPIIEKGWKRHPAVCPTVQS